MGRPNRPLVAEPLSRIDRGVAWLQKFVSNGLAIVALAVAVLVLSVSGLVLQNSLTAARHERDAAQGETNCRSRISFQYGAVNSDLQAETARGLIALQNGDDGQRALAAANVAQILPVLDAIRPVYKDAIKVCAEDSSYRLIVPAYGGAN